MPYGGCCPESTEVSGLFRRLCKLIPEQGPAGADIKKRKISYVYSLKIEANVLTKNLMRKYEKI